MQSNFFFTHGGGVWCLLDEKKFIILSLILSSVSGLGAVQSRVLKKFQMCVERKAMGCQ